MGVSTPNSQRFTPRRMSRSTAEETGPVARRFIEAKGAHS